jgi:hypothetical protein
MSTWLSHGAQIFEAGMQAQTYNPNYSGGRRWEDHSLRPIQAKFIRPHLNQWMDVVAHTCHLSQLNRKAQIGRS